MKILHYTYIGPKGLLSNKPGALILGWLGDVLGVHNRSVHMTNIKRVQRAHMCTWRILRADIGRSSGPNQVKGGTSRGQGGHQPIGKIYL